jgi:hypothetical protein
MGLGKEMQDRIYQSLDESYGQVGFFQDQVVIVDDEKKIWDTAIESLDGNLLGQIEIVNRAIDDVKDAYVDHFTGVTSCRSDLFWVAKNVEQGSSWNGSFSSLYRFTFECVKLNPNGYTDVIKNMSGNLVGIASTYFWYLYPAGGGVGILTTSPTNATTGAEQTPKTGNEEQGGGFPYFEHHTADTFRFGFDPKNYYGLKYYSEQYALDIGDTFITSFIGTMSVGSNQLVVMNPVGTTGEDPDAGSNILRVGQIVTCDEPGVLVATTKISNITTGSADLSQIPTNGITTTSSPVNIITLTNPSGIGVSVFDAVSFRVLDDSDTGPVGQVGVVTSNGAVYKPNTENGKDDPYVAVPSSSDQGGVGALFNVGIASAGADSPNTIEYVAVDVVGQGGLGYSPGDTIKILGDELGATTPADDIEFTVQTNPQGRFKYQIKMGDNIDLWINPFVPQTVGIMQTADIGIGVSIALDNSGKPKGAQGWNPELNGQEVPMDPTDFTHLTLVEPPNVGADKSYWKVGFQTAPVTSAAGVRAYQGQSLGYVDGDQLATLLTTLSACSSDSNTNISNAKSTLTTVETSFTDHTGNNKLMVDASNALRGERNEVCKRIWGLRQSIGNVNDRITQLEGAKRFIDTQNIVDVIDND